MLKLGMLAICSVHLLLKSFCTFLWQGQHKQVMMGFLHKLY